MVLLVPEDGAADEAVGQALLSYGLQDSTRKSCSDGRICEEAVSLCKQLKGLKMSQLVSRASTYAERGTARHTEPGMDGVGRARVEHVFATSVTSPPSGRGS